MSVRSGRFASPQGISLLEKEIAQGGDSVDNLKSQVTTAWCTIAELYMTDLWYGWSVELQGSWFRSPPGIDRPVIICYNVAHSNIACRCV